MRALIVASFLLIAAPALAQTSTPSGAAAGQNGQTPTTSNPAVDPTARSYVNPQTTEAPKNDDNHNPNYQTPAGSQTSQPGKENPSGADRADRKAR